MSLDLNPHLRNTFRSAKDAPENRPSQLRASRVRHPLSTHKSSLKQSSVIVLKNVV